MQKYFNKGAPDGVTLEFPLTEQNFPTSAGSTLASPKVGNKYDTIAPYFCDDPEFDEELSDVIKVRSDVAKGIWPNWFLVKYGSKTEGYPTDFLKTFVVDQPNGRHNPQKAANIVRMDDPFDMGLELLKYWGGKGEYPTFKVSALNEHTKFIEGVQTFNKELMSDLVDVLNKSFEVKYYWGVSRPEEVLTLGNGFTHYPEGCPTHPATPAGHSSVGGQTVETIVRWFNLSDEQYQELIETAFQWGHYRTFAGVHYPQDNLMGLGLSSPIMRSEYPQVAEKFIV